MQKIVKSRINTGNLIVPTATLSSVCHPLLESKESLVTRRRSWVILSNQYVASQGDGDRHAFGLPDREYPVAKMTPRSQNSKKIMKQSEFDKLLMISPFTLDNRPGELKWGALINSCGRN